MKFRIIEESPKILILVFETGDELAGGLLQFANAAALPAGGLDNGAPGGLRPQCMSTTTGGSYRIPMAITSKPCVIRKSSLGS